MVHSIPSEVRWPRIVAAWRLGSSVFQDNAGLIDTCCQKTLSYSAYPVPPCLRASRIIRHAYASILRVKSSGVRMAM